MTHNLNARTACAYFDKGRSGVVSLGDFRRGLARLQVPADDTVVAALFREADIAKDGVLDYREMHQYLTDQRTRPRSAAPLCPSRPHLTA